MLTNQNSLEQYIQVCHNAREQSFNSNVFEMKLSLTSVYTQQKAIKHQNQLKTIFGINLKFKQISNINISKLFSHYVTQGDKSTN
jgi:hypothetical protein